MKHSRELVFVCTGSDCKKAGGKKLLKELEKEVKNEPFKGKCKLIATKCMDMCKSCPMAIIDSQFIKRADATKVESAIKKALEIQS